jgi:hypothetical protein
LTSTEYRASVLYMKRKLEQLSCKYGAQMGRKDNVPSDIITMGKLHLERLNFVDGDYDYGGAYWGGGTSEKIYWAYGETSTAQIDIFVRAKDRSDAKEKVRLEMINFTEKSVIFYR